MLVTQTPLRVSLAGGGTDLASYYEGGAGQVVSTAIDKHMYVIVNERFDDQIYLSWSKKEIVDRVDDLQHELVREAMRKAGIERGIEIAIMADVPSFGSGLGSSSALTVGLLNAFHALAGSPVTPAQLAEEACEIEIDLCGKPIGKQDQYIAAYGGLRAFAFLPDGTVTVEDLRIGPARHTLAAHLLLFFTNRRRKAEDILERQVKRSEVNRPALARIGALATDAREAIVAERFARIGEILSESWQIKRELAEGISDPEIDAMVEQALGAGAVGCKVSGAGGGGFLLAYVPPDRQPDVRRALASYRELPISLERFGSRILFHVEGPQWRQQATTWMT